MDNWTLGPMLIAGYGTAGVLLPSGTGTLPSGGGNFGVAAERNGKGGGKGKVESSCAFKTIRWTREKPVFETNSEFRYGVPWRGPYRINQLGARIPIFELVKQPTTAELSCFMVAYRTFHGGRPETVLRCPATQILPVF